MHATASTERSEFAPPPPPGQLRAVGLALLAHLLLVGALTWGVHWKRASDNELAVEAELWSSVPQQAAPRLVEAPPPPPPPPPEPQRVQPRPTPPGPTEAEIALARQKKDAERREAEQLELDRQRQARGKRERELRKAAEDKRLKEEKQRAEDDKRKQAEKQQAQQREARAKEEARQAAELNKQRTENLRRIAGMAGATGGETASGNALRSAGPSASYAGRIRARIKPNIVFSDDVAGNPVAEVEVRAAPDGTIVGRKLMQSSGVKAWDEAVLKAIDKTEVLPRDTDGRVPSTLVISFKLRE